MSRRKFIAERIHFLLAAAQNLPFTEGESCEECLYHADDILKLAAAPSDDVAAARAAFAEEIVTQHYCLTGQIEKVCTCGLPRDMKINDAWRQWAEHIRKLAALEAATPEAKGNDEKS